MRPAPPELLDAIRATIARDVVGSITDPFVRTQVELMIPALTGIAAAWDGEADTTRAAVSRLERFFDDAATELFDHRSGDDAVSTLRARIVDRGIVPVEANALRECRLSRRALLADLLIVCERDRERSDDLARLRTEAYAVATST